MAAKPRRRGKQRPYKSVSMIRGEYFGGVHTERSERRMYEEGTP